MKDSVDTTKQKQTYFLRAVDIVSELVAVKGPFVFGERARSVDYRVVSVTVGIYNQSPIKHETAVVYTWVTCFRSRDQLIVIELPSKRRTQW